MFSTAISSDPERERLILAAGELMDHARNLGVALWCRVEESSSGQPLIRFTEGQDELYSALRIYEGLTPSQLEDVVRQELFEILSLTVLNARAAAMVRDGVRLRDEDLLPPKVSAEG